MGIESRGFIFASPLSLRLNAKFVLARKPGKHRIKIKKIMIWNMELIVLRYIKML